MKSKRQNKTAEMARNVFLILLAVIIVVIFFNLDIMQKGESVFSRTATTDLKFSGALGPKDYTDNEISKLRTYMKIRKKILEEIKIEASPQDSYKGVTPDTQVLFEVHVVMRDGVSFTTPVRRTKRKHLADAILAKLDKDVTAYKQLKKEGKKVKGLINTM